MADIQKTLKNLERNGFTAAYFETAEEAKAAILEEIGNASVGRGGSLTLNQLGLYETLEAQGNPVHWHSKQRDDPMAFQKAQYSDVYLSGTNAITEDGQLVNTDYYGNRVSAMAFGAKKLIVVVGKNKIVKDVPEAMKRIKGYMAGLNARKAGKKTPCAVDLVCRDCKSPDRMCCVTTIMEYKPFKTEKAMVCIVGETLGYE